MKILTITVWSVGRWWISLVEWIKFSDKMPPMNTKILVADAYGIECVIIGDRSHWLGEWEEWEPLGNGNFVSPDGLFNKYMVHWPHDGDGAEEPLFCCNECMYTHWMPLPEPPKEGD